MLSRLLLTIRVILGVAVGSYACGMVMWSVSTALAAAVGGGPWKIVYVMTEIGSPMAALTGAVAGGWAAWRMAGKRFLLVAAPSALAIALVAAFASGRSQRASAHAAADAQGCQNIPLSTEHSSMGWIATFDRYCETAPMHTVNVSIQGGPESYGPGNVLVVDGDERAVRASPMRQLYVFAGAIDSTHLSIVYDTNARVITRKDSVGRIAVEYKIDSTLTTPN